MGMSSTPMALPAPPMGTSKGGAAANRALPTQAMAQLPQSMPLPQGRTFMGMPGTGMSGQQQSMNMSLGNPQGTPYGIGQGGTPPGMLIAALRAQTNQAGAQPMQFRTTGTPDQAAYTAPTMGPRAMSSSDWQRQQMAQMPTPPQGTMKPTSAAQRPAPTAPASRVGYDPAQRVVDL